MSVGHCGLICFADLFRDRIVLGSLARLATESGPENKKTCENCIRYVGFVPKSHVPFTRPATPPHPTHLRASCSLERRLRRSLSLSLSLFLSNDSARRRASGSGDNGCIQPSRKKKFESLGSHLSFSKRSAGFEVFFRKGGTQKHMHIRVM